VLDVLCDTLDLFGLGGSVGHGGLLGQLAGVHDEKPAFCPSAAPIRVLSFHLADDPVPVPAARRLLAGTARFVES
jgi:hypothetical protein